MIFNLHKHLKFLTKYERYMIPKVKSTAYRWRPVVDNTTPPIMDTVFRVEIVVQMLRSTSL